MEPSILTDELISTLKERDILVQRDVIASALEDSVTAPNNAEWISKHLRPETLLSKEELILYSRLESTGTLQSILRDPDLNATRPFLEGDIRVAIESLQASTAAINKQTKLLSIQCESLRKTMRRQDGLDQNRSQEIARLRKKHEAGRQNTTVAAIDLSNELETIFRSEMEKTGTENKRILSTLSTQLKQDDQVLARLETIMSGVKSNRGDASTVKRAAHLSSLLANYSASEIHCRLDRLYLEALHFGGSSIQPSTDESVDILEQELESLYPEIEILAQMSTEQEFHDPVLREIYNEHSILGANSQQKLEQVHDALIDMTRSKQTWVKELVGRESSCELLEKLATLYQTEAASQLMQSSSRRDSLRRRSTQSVLHTATRTENPVPDQPALENILRRNGVTPDSVLRPSAENTGDSAMYEKRIHMRDLLQNLGIGTEAPLVAHLISSDSALQLLSSSLHASSPYAKSLRNASQEEAILGLERELELIQKGIQGLNLDVLHRRDKMQDQFLGQWR
ncbi:hypothetical protein N7495_008838 [Penicillium taxi]|uniref:uncharacterized protein n=1 Tax=Penicillium taxi TaxID=168475 RepID=UPI002544E291|nr:uncharacterized protein N7495_008838 [Penicillium taxi]KAJ5888797.1 hypothetical protein N7495_008838 [Penicillium taxi]